VRTTTDAEYDPARAKAPFFVALITPLDVLLDAR
jgi:hypothetical protein